MFRAARPGDFAQIMSLYRQLHPDDPVHEDGSDAAAFQQILDSPGLHLFVLELDGALVATTYLNVIPNISRSTSPYAVIENVVVEASRRGTGLGRQTDLPPHPNAPGRGGAGRVGWRASAARRGPRRRCWPAGSRR
ncbi:GNAT family N-acetyltransferase [Micromonospora sp. DT233]|uniref:GNAT family N-acetyltransferase n=1 Tax=Micromonospora sp. DT233 TaxID=3393432 RepID=UPI003CEADD9B